MRSVLPQNMAVNLYLLTFIILTLRFSSHSCTPDTETIGEGDSTYWTESAEEDPVENGLGSTDGKNGGSSDDVGRIIGEKFGEGIEHLEKDGNVVKATEHAGEATGDVEEITESEEQDGKTDDGGDSEKETADGTDEHDGNISQSVSLFNVHAMRTAMACLRVDAGDERCSRVPSFSDIIVDGRSSEDFRLMSDAVVSHNMSSFMWVNQTDVATRRITCVPRNGTQQRVRIVTSAELIQMLGPKNETHGHCAVVMFYAPWCVFCARVAPHFNALARAFPQLDVLAIDAMYFSNLNSRFGTVAVPSILLFHNYKAVSRFNGTLRILDSLVSFLTNVTGLQPNTSVGVLPDDYNGPLASVPTAGHDYLLWLAWSFTIIFFAVVLARSTVVARLIHCVLSFGQEHQAIH